MAAVWGTEMAQCSPRAQAALLAGSPSPPARSERLLAPTNPPRLLLSEDHSWAEVDEYFLPDPSMQEQSAPARS